MSCMLQFSRCTSRKESSKRKHWETPQYRHGQQTPPWSDWHNLFRSTWSRFAPFTHAYRPGMARAQAQGKVSIIKSSKRCLLSVSSKQCCLMQLWGHMEVFEAKCIEWMKFRICRPSKDCISTCSVPLHPKLQYCFAQDEDQDNDKDREANSLRSSGEPSSKALHRKEESNLAAIKFETVNPEIDPAMRLSWAGGEPSNHMRDNRGDADSQASSAATSRQQLLPPDASVLPVLKNLCQACLTGPDLFLHEPYRLQIFSSILTSLSIQAWELIDRTQVKQSCPKPQSHWCPMLKMYHWRVQVVTLICML